MTQSRPARGRASGHRARLGRRRQALAFLRDRAINDPEPPARAAALQAIAQGWGGDVSAVFPQDRAINDPEPPVRAAALQAIAQRWYGDQALAFLQDRAINDPELRNDI